MAVLLLQVVDCLVQPGRTDMRSRRPPAWLCTTLPGIMASSPYGEENAVANDDTQQPRWEQVRIPVPGVAGHLLKAPAVRAKHHGIKTLVARVGVIRRACQALQGEPSAGMILQVPEQGVHRHAQGMAWCINPYGGVLIMKCRLRGLS